MELIGLALGCVLLAGAGVVLGLVFALVRSLRRFILPAVVVPPTSFLLLMLSSWWLLDRSPICGPDPEWDRCPSHSARIAQLCFWLLATAVLAIVALILQKLAVLGWENFVYRKQSLNIIEKSKDV
ncbi:MAG TPA: hypothetical protein VE178_20145 [Silvibacterium sp.]|nr:hypothetical protein [Silvibacterium sp.]